MSEHVFDWIPAYHDGELTGAARQSVEAHLAGCAECRASLAELRALSSLLGADPLPAGSLPSADFAAGIVRRLPSREAQRWPRALVLGLRFIPLGLFALWAFFQAVIWLSSGVLLAVGVFPGAANLLDVFRPFAAFTSVLPLQMDLLNALTGTLSTGQPWLDTLGIFIITSMAFTALLASLFAGWLAALWAFWKSRNSENENGSHSYLTTRA